VQGPGWASLGIWRLASGGAGTAAMRKGVLHLQYAECR
jgi:hypothetical protein